MEKERIEVEAVVEKPLEEEVFPQKQKKAGKIVKASTAYILSALSLIVGGFMLYYMITLLVGLAPDENALGILITVIFTVILLIVSTVVTVFANTSCFTLYLSNKKDKNVLIAYIINSVGLVCNLAALVLFVIAVA